MPLPQRRQVFDRSRQRRHLVDDRLDIAQFQTVLAQDGETTFHQHVVVGNIPGREPQLGNAGFFGKRDPHLRHQHAFEIHRDQQGSFGHVFSFP